MLCEDIPTSKRYHMQQTASTSKLMEGVPRKPSQGNVQTWQ